MENILKNKLKDTLYLSDSLLERIKKDKDLLKSNLENIINKDKNGEEVDEEIKTHQFLVYSGVLLETDFFKTLSEVATLYSLIKSSNIDLDLSKEDIDRLEHNLLNNHYNFVAKNNEVSFKNSTVEDTIKNRIEEKTNDFKVKFLEDIRKSYEKS